MALGRNEFRQLAIELYGATGWRRAVQQSLDVDRVTVWRWEKNGAPPRVLKLLRATLKLTKLTRTK